MMAAPFTPALLAADLWAWSLEIACVVAVAAGAARLLADPQWRLWFWHGVLTAALLLPVLGPWRQPEPLAAGDAAVSISGALPADFPGIEHTWKSGRTALAVVTGGAVLRLAWLGIGLYRLRRMRENATPLAQGPVGVESAGRIRWHESGAITGPVTFGWRRPSILLPARWRDLPDNLRRAIACHEVVHVRRHDWLYVLAEELGRSVLWFHPAIWYALGQAQLAREQAVDAEAVAMTGDRESYLEALLAVAERKLSPDVAPAPLFLKRRHLAARVAVIMKETHMTGSSLLAHALAAVSAATVAAAVAVWMFPLQSPAQALPDAPGVRVDAGGKLLHSTPVRFPADAPNGTVVLEATLNAQGEVADARVLSGPDELRKGALESVLEWHYSAEVAPPPTVRIAIQLERVSSATSSPATPRLPTVKGSLPASAAQWTGTIADIRYPGLSADLAQQIESRMPVRKGDPYTHETFGSVVSAMSAVDRHLKLTVQIDRDGGPVILVVELASAQAAAAPEAITPQRVRVGGNIQSRMLMTKVPPVYPPDAKQARVQGKVSLGVLIAPDGSVANVQLVKGDAMLAPSAMDAVRQWVYRPTLVNGQPVEVLTMVDVNYTLLP